MSATLIRPGVPLLSAIPCCPQFRLARRAGTYPVRGYCTLGVAPGGLMVPSTEEFQTACTTRQYAHCPWFDDAPESPAPGASPAACRVPGRPAGTHP
jgi:hypothetical protein